MLFNVYIGEKMHSLKTIKKLNYKYCQKVKLKIENYGIDYTIKENHAKTKKINLPW